jgi:serine/threonine-protein kinase
MQLPARIGKYELEEFLGGGMSHVYRARDTVIGRTVAVKILTEEGCKDEEAKARFLAEAQMAGNLEHENVIAIYDFGEDDQHRPFMVMEFLRGENLRSAIREQHTGDMRTKLRIALDIARALQYIHSRKIIHRDIKPDNIHLTTTGVVKLMDFGIAKTEGLSMTRAGYVLGTPYYMAPEQVQGQEITEQVDVYAFGILLFELLTGARPITADSVERIFYYVLNEPLNLEPLYGAGVPPAVCNLVARCTAKGPPERPAGFAPVCAELGNALAQLDAPTLALTGQAVPAPPRKRPAWLLPAALALVAALGAAAYIATRPKPPAAAVVQPPTPAPAPAKQVEPAARDMVLVPAGSFLMGEKKESASLSAFYIDKTKVTNQAYAAFCRATNRELPPDFPTDKPDYPVVNVTIADARAFAARTGKRLPTEREWEKAARGDKGRKYPWGEEKEPAYANVDSKALRPVADFPQGASPYGALDMIGNGNEMVDQKGTPLPEDLEFFKTRLTPPPTAADDWYVFRGLRYIEPLVDNAVWDHGVFPSQFRSPMMSFRCAKDAQ